MLQITSLEMLVCSEVDLRRLLKLLLEKSLFPAVGNPDIVIMWGLCMETHYFTAWTTLNVILVC